MSKAKKLILGLLFILALLALGYSFTSSKNKPVTKYTTQSPKEAEKGGPKILTIENAEDLSKYLLADQLVFVRNEMSSYVLAKVDPNAKSIAILNSPKLLSNGNLSFNILVKDSNKTLDILLDRSTYPDTIIFYIPSANYSVKLAVYGSDAVGD